ncbi:hypothetical protein [Lysobacter enzymogenes]|nr:hypothetical protein [Lysobacter enzymogenes]
MRSLASFALSLAMPATHERAQTASAVFPHALALNAVNKTVDATTPAHAGPIRVLHFAMRARRHDGAGARRLRALRRSAAQCLLLLALLADLIALPAWSMGLPFAVPASARCESAPSADTTPAAPAQTTADFGDPSPHAPDLPDVASAAGEQAECEPCVLPPSLRTPAPSRHDAALPEPRQAARATPHSPDPRPPLA